MCRISKRTYNIGNDVTSCPEIRRALAYAMDRELMARTVLGGFGRPAYSENDGMPWNNPETAIETDWDYARELLAEAGWADADGDGILEKDGLRAEFSCIYPAGDSVRQAVAMAASQQAEEIGIRIRVEGVSWDEISRRMFSEAVMMGWTGDNGDPDNFFATLFSCAAAKDGSNYSRWCYKPFEDLIQPARATDDHNKRIELYKQAQVVMHDQAPALIVAHSTVYEPVRKEVKGYVVDPLGKHHFENVSVE